MFYATLMLFVYYARFASPVSHDNFVVTINQFIAW